MYKFDYYNENNSIIRLKLEGKLTIEIIEQMSIELNEKATNKQMLLFTDARNVEFSFNPSNISEIIQLTNKFVKPEVTIFEAILIDTPQNTALTMLFDFEKKRDNHYSRIFSTENAAIDWLLNSSK